MAWDVAAIRQRLTALGKRDWPQEWGQREEEAIGDYFGWCHRYRLDDPLPAAEVEAFERAHRITLPADYRSFLIELGNGGAGPDYGIFRLGEGEEEELWPEVLDAIGQPFALTEAWNDTSQLSQPELYYGYDLMAGAVPVGTKGCALDYWMVVSGEAAGQIWLDQRSDKAGVAPVRGPDGAILTFKEWYEAWLNEAWERFAG